MIINFKIYESLKDEFEKMKKVSYQSFDLKHLENDCMEFKIKFLDLLNEMLIGRKIAFQCLFCLTPDLDNTIYSNHKVLDVCKDIMFDNSCYCYIEEGDILVRLVGDPNWHAIYSGRKIRVRVYNYEKGPLMKELELQQNIKKYNL